MRQYITGWQLLDFPPDPPLRLNARGWSLVTQACPDVFKRRYPRGWRDFPTHSREILIEAPDRDIAQHAANCLSAAAEIVGGFGAGALFGIHQLDSIVAIPRDEKDREGLDASQIENGLSATRTFGDMRGAMKLGTRMTWRRNWQYAAFKLFSSFAQVGISWHETHPDEYHFNPAKKFRWSSDHVRLTTALTLAYAAIEELGLTVRPLAIGTKEPRSKLPSGEWVPEVIANVQERLSKAHVHTRQALVWAIRGAVRKHERVKKIRAAGPTSWTRGVIRDVYVSVPDALEHARWLRNKVTGHRIDDRARSLTIYEVYNVQMLARFLIISATNAWLRRPTNRLPA